MKNFICLFTIFVLVHMAKGDHVRAYEGQSPETVTALLKAEGKTGVFISQSEYQKFIDAYEQALPKVI